MRRGGRRAYEKVYEVYPCGTGGDFGFWDSGGGGEEIEGERV